MRRKWTIQPDELEKNRREMKFLPVDKMTALAGGKLQVFPIDGIASECSLVCYLADDHLLWASDYIQNPREATAYATEVINAVNREKLHPQKMVAEHVGLTDWAQIVRVNTP